MYDDRVQSAEAGERDEYEPERQVGQPTKRRSAFWNNRCSHGDPMPASRTDEKRGELSVGSERGQKRHGCYQTRVGHRAAGQRRNRRT